MAMVDLNDLSLEYSFWELQQVGKLREGSNTWAQEPNEAPPLMGNYPAVLLPDGSTC